MQARLMCQQDHAKSKVQSPTRRETQFAKIAMSAGIVSHNNPFKRKKTIPQNPSLLIQVFKLISVLLSRKRLEERLSSLRLLLSSLLDPSPSTRFPVINSRGPHNPGRKWH